MGPVRLASHAPKQRKIRPIRTAASRKLLNFYRKKRLTIYILEPWNIKQFLN
jgi:1-acyl-sn-glycerol-3-phosphate acyltransferase